MKASAYHAIGPYTRDGFWHTATFISKAFWAYDYNGAGHAERTSEAEPLYHSYTGAGHTWAMDELFEFNSGVYVSDISVGVMEKYAVVIGGGDPDDPSGNYPAFWNDAKIMYNNLVINYNYLPENVYFHFWNDTKGYKDGVYIDGPATSVVPTQDQPVRGIGVWDSLEELSNKMTKDDFFILFGRSHGGTGCFDFLDGDWKYTEFAHFIDNSSYARAVLIFSACDSGTAIKGTPEHPEANLKGANRIIITSTDADEIGYNEVESNSEHGAFLYEGCVDNIYHHYYYPGFLKCMGSIFSPSTVKDAYDCGYNAATHNHVGWMISESTPQIFNSEMAENTYW